LRAGSESERGRLVQRQVRSDPEREERLRAYWRANMKLIGVLVVIWFLAGYAHPPFARALNSVTILTGFPLGYWLASQFSITVFVILIFIYALVMNRVIDPKYGFGSDE
jgi:putative solute:sodium symporter small subunit